MKTFVAIACFFFTIAFIGEAESRNIENRGLLDDLLGSVIDGVVDGVLGGVVSGAGEALDAVGDVVNCAVDGLGNALNPNVPACQPQNRK